MVKNVNGGKHKNQARKHTNNDKKLRVKKDELELYAYVENKLGGNKILVFCLDGKTRLCTIPGKFINKGRRDNVIEKGVWLLVGLRDWETPKERENCDLLEVYNDNEKSKLKNNINEDWGIFLPKEIISDDIHFTNDYEDQQEKIKNEIVNNVQTIIEDEEIDFNDI